MGVSPRSSTAILRASLSTQMTSWPNSAKHAAATKPTYPDPMTETLTIAVNYNHINKHINCEEKKPGRGMPCSKHVVCVGTKHFTLMSAPQLSLPPHSP